MEVFKETNKYVSFLDFVMFVLFVSFLKLQIVICNGLISPTTCVMISCSK